MEVTTELEQRIQRLEDIEAIRCLQAKYQRCLDTRDFDGLAECLAPDVTTSYDGGKMSYQGREQAIGFLRKVMTSNLPSSHLIHGGEIEISGSNDATAKWYLEDHLLHRKLFVKLHGAAIYDVRYVKSDGIWRISSIGYQRCYQYVEGRHLLNLLSFGKTTYLDKMD